MGTVAVSAAAWECAGSWPGWSVVELSLSSDSPATEDIVLGEKAQWPKDVSLKSIPLCISLAVKTPGAPASNLLLAAQQPAGPRPGLWAGVPSTSPFPRRLNAV